MADLISPTTPRPKEIQASIVDGIIAARRAGGFIINDREASFEAQRLLALIDKSNGPLTKKIELEELSQISSDTWNAFQDALGIDIRAIYESILPLETVNKQMDQIANSELNAAKAAISAAINQLRVYAFLRAYPDYQDLKIVDFIRAVNATKRSPAAVVDNKTKSLELPRRFRDRISSSQPGIRFSSVEVINYGKGTSGGLGNQFPPSNMVDASVNSFWAEMISADSPIKLTHPLSWGERECPGVVSEAILTLSVSGIANSLRLLPFYEYPYNVIDIAYKESTNSSRWLTLPGFKIIEDVTDWVALDFPQIIIQQLRVTIEQTNFNKVNYLIPRDVLHKNALLDQITSVSAIEDLIEADFTAAEGGRVEADPSQLAYLSALRLIDQRFSDIELSGERASVTKDYTSLFSIQASLVDSISPGTSTDISDITGTTPKNLSEEVLISRYEYMYGIRELELSRVIYEPQGYYESDKFVCSGTVVQCQIESDELHQTFNDGIGDFRRTSVEWNLEVAPDLRFPIVPVTDIYGENYIVREEVLNLTNGSGLIRFTPLGNSFEVRKNGQRVSSSLVTLSSRNITISGAAINSIYTITYYVDESNTKVDFDTALNSTALLTPEIFTKTDQNNSILLKSYPYIVYEIVRDERLWNKDPIGAKWTWNPSVFPLSSGTVTITNDSKTVTGASTLFTSLNTSVPLYLYLEATGEHLKIASITNDTVLLLQENYSGRTASAQAYVAGHGVDYDGRIWGVGTQAYEPIKVTVDGIPATNLTSYIDHEHPAFTETDKDNFQYIHSGGVLIFNHPIDNRRISVSYNWLIQYLKLLATLRCSVPVATVLSPRVKSARIRIKSSEL